MLHSQWHSKWATHQKHIFFRFPKLADFTDGANENFNVPRAAKVTPAGLKMYACLGSGASLKHGGRFKFAHFERFASKLGVPRNHVLHDEGRQSKSTKAGGAGHKRKLTIIAQHFFLLIFENCLICTLSPTPHISVIGTMAVE